MKNFLITFIFTAFINGCSNQPQEEISSYQLEIFKYLNSEQLLKLNTGIDAEITHLLFYDHKLTCKTCIMDLLDIIKPHKEIAILSHFESDIELDYFIETYKVENRMVNFNAPEHHLPVPFVFQLNENKAFNIMIFDDDVINPKSFHQYMKKSKTEKFMFYN